MADNLVDALQITLVGMTLVFGAIALLWLTMSLLVRFTAEDAEAAEAAPDDVPAALDEHERKRRAVIAAVAVALARDAADVEPREFPLPPTAEVSPWQAVQRGRLLAQKGPRR